MAEGVLFNIAEEIIKTLGSLTAQEVALWWGIKDQLRKLNDTVTRIKAVIQDAEEQAQKQKHQIEDWLMKLREAVYDAEDLLDDFSTQVLRNQLMPGNRVSREVTVDGMVFNKAERSTDVSFVIDDGTGRIGCRRWVTENFEKLEMEAVQDEMYVRVIGHLRVFQDVKQLVAFSVRPATNFDEITFHFTDCIHSHLQNSKLQGGTSTQPHMVESSMNTPVQNGQTFTSNLMSKQFDVDGLKDCDQLVLDRLQQSSSIGQEKGMHMDELCQQLKLPMEKIKESIRSLEDEGLIYSTIDEFHYKAT